MKIYIVGTYLNHLIKVLQISTHKLCFHGKKYIHTFQLKKGTLSRTMNNKTE